MKKILTILLLLALIVLPAMSNSLDTATLTLKTTVGESVDNAGIRLMQGSTVPVGITEFDNQFSTAASTLLIENTDDNSINDVTGSFVILVKRLTSGSITVTITAQPLVGLGNHTIPYVLTSAEGFDSGGNVLSVDDVSLVGKYETTSAVNSMIRHPNLINYSIPANTSVPLGDYVGNIVFTLTLP